MNADGDTLQEIVDEMNNNVNVQFFNSAEELRYVDDANMWGDINIKAKWRAKLCLALRKKPRLQESESELPTSTSTLIMD